MGKKKTPHDPRASANGIPHAETQTPAIPRVPTSPSDEIAVLQQILLLHDGQLENFHPVRPPSPVRRFLNRATLGELQGLLVETLSALRERKDDPA